jgi:hypothetical protein
MIGAGWYILSMGCQWSQMPVDPRGNEVFEFICFCWTRSRGVVDGVDIERFEAERVIDVVDSVSHERVL